MANHPAGPTSNLLITGIVFATGLVVAVLLWFEWHLAILALVLELSLGAFWHHRTGRVSAGAHPQALPRDTHFDR